MAEIKKILFPVELSPVSEKIVPFVTLQADRFQAEVHVLHVVPSLIYHTNPYFSEEEIKKTQSGLMIEAQKKLAEFCQAHLPQAKLVLMVGDPVEAIIDYVIKEKISLVVMGTHGRKGLDRIIMGSVTLRVLRRCPAPVLTVNPFLLEGPVTRPEWPPRPAPIE